MPIDPNLPFPRHKVAGDAMDCIWRQGLLISWPL